MKTFFKIIQFTILLILIVQISNAQQCQGSFGDPIVNITFGAGVNPGAALSAATTNYQYVTTDCPSDGYYTVRNNTSNCFSNSWLSLTADHTGDANGYFMLVNSSLQPSAFFVDTIRGLCANSTYEFAAWVINVLQPTACGSNGNKPNISFLIEKTDGTLLGSYNSGDIQPTSSPVWIRYAFSFTTTVGVSDVVIRMVNNGLGGCGNDLALDDITFRRCGPQITQNIVGLNTTSAVVCEGSTSVLNFTANVSNGFTSPVYQWQQSFNGAPFTDIVGANTLSYIQTFNASNVIGTYKYRLAVAELGTLSVSNCRVVSTPITINVLANPMLTANSNSPVCENQTLTLTANGANTYIWSGPNGFTSSNNPANIVNTALLQAGNYFVTGTDNNGCTSTVITLVTVNAAPIAATSFADSTICNSKNVQLLATGGTQFEWSPVNHLNNSTIASPTANPSDTTNYRVVVKNIFNCTDTAYVKINVVKKPNVDAGANKIIVQTSSVQLNGTITGAYTNFYWTSLGPLLSNSNILNPTAIVQNETIFYLTANALNQCGAVTDSVFVKIYSGLFIPNTFTPNGDNLNDTWYIPALEAYPLHTLQVFNRYGQIVFDKKIITQKWDGKYKGENLPNGHYIYIIDLHNGTTLIKGAVLIMR